eukprot:3782682-Pleurochrysis_carterae.AAC.5
MPDTRHEAGARRLRGNRAADPACRRRRPSLRHRRCRIYFTLPRMLVQVLAFVPLTAQCCHALTTPYTPTSRSMQAHAPSARLDLRHVRRASSWARYAVIKSVSTSGRVQQPVMLGAGCTATLNDIRAKLAAVRALRPLEETKEVQTSLWEAAGIDPIYKVSGSVSGEPSFTRLFTHETWSSYNGKPPLRRWLRTAATWRYSTILRSVYPITIIASMWAIFVASLPSRLLPRTSPVPMSLMGTALGLLLVFRTNNSYQRLGEARGLWGRAVYLCRELAQGVATALLYDDNVEDPDQAREAAASICAYLVAWAWETNARLTGKPAEGKSPPRQRDGPLPGEDLEVLRALLPRAEAEWIGAQRSRPLQLIGSIRRSLHQQYRRGNLPWHIHRKLEEGARLVRPIALTALALFCENGRLVLRCPVCPRGRTG